MWEEREDVLEAMEKVEKKWYDMGFREGLLQGKLESSQGAFDIGFHKGALEAFLEVTRDHLPQELRESLQNQLTALNEQQQ